MRSILALFFCVAVMGAGCLGADDDLKYWMAQATKVKPGMRRADVEAILPRYVPPPKFTLTMSNGIVIHYPDPAVKVGPGDLAFGPHYMTQYRVARDVVAEFDYYGSDGDSKSGDLLNSVSVQYKPWVEK